MDNPVVMQMVLLLVLIGIMYLLLIRPQKKREKETNLMRSSIKAGDEIVTIGGICGKVVKTKDETLVIQVGADKVKFEIMRWAISKVVSSDAPTTKKPVREEADDDMEEAPKKITPRRMKPVSSEETTEVEAEVVESEVVSEEDK